MQRNLSELLLQATLSTQKGEDSAGAIPRQCREVPSAEEGLQNGAWMGWENLGGLEGGSRWSTAEGTIDICGTSQGSCSCGSGGQGVGQSEKL